MTDTRPMIAGAAEGELLFLQRPISFWGGVDPGSGVITDPRHPQHGTSISRRVVAIERTIGSSSSSAVMLELLAGGHAPAALILGQVDAILTLGVVVAGEMDYPMIPVLYAPGAMAELAGRSGPVRVAHDGTITFPSAARP